MLSGTSTRPGQSIKAGPSPRSMVDLLSVMRQRFSGLFHSTVEGPLTRVRLSDVVIQHHSGTGSLIMHSGPVERTAPSRAIAQKFGINLATGHLGTHFSMKLDASACTDDELVTYLLKLRKATTALKLHRASASFKLGEQKEKRLELA